MSRGVSAGQGVQGQTSGGVGSGSSPSELTQSHRPLGVSFESLDEDVLLLTAFNHVEELGRPSVTMLELCSATAGLDPVDVVGHPALVRLDTDDGERYIRGYVWAFESLGQEGGLWRYRAELRPWLGMMEANREYRTFQEQTAKDVVGTLFGAHSSAMSWRDETRQTYRSREYCVQYGESDLAFISRLLEDEGAYYTFEYSETDETLVLHDDSTFHGPRPGDATMPYQPAGSPGAHDPEAIVEFSRRSEYRYARHAAIDYSPASATTYLYGLCAGTIENGPSWKQRHAIVDAFDGVRPAGEMPGAATTRMQESEAGADVYEGRTLSRQMRVGTTFNLSEHRGYGDVSDPFLLTKVYLSARGAPFVSGQVAGNELEFDCTFEAMPADRPFRPRRLTPKPKAEVQTAFVVGASESDTSPNIADDGGCSVRVRFHWDHAIDGRHMVGDSTAVSSTGSSCWVRVSQSWAGKLYGWVSVPHPGQEVIVAFIDGDPDRPIVVGRVYNSQNKPEFDPFGSKLKTQLRDSGFNHFVMDGTPGSEGIELLSPMGQTRIRMGRGW